MNNVDLDTGLIGTDGPDCDTQWDSCVRSFQGVGVSSGVSLLGQNAADDLVGKTLPTGWLVTQKVRKDALDTGGNFSINYLVEHPDNRRGFCKVVNFEWLLQVSPNNSDPIAALNQATAIYQFERDLARKCVRLSRVITAIDDGSFNIPGYAQGLVSYIIFESAESDIRGVLNKVAAVDAASRLRCIHNLAVGIRQLHTIGIAHQDVKPSNTLVFAQSQTQSGLREAKIGDLGRASVRGETSLYDHLDITGDPKYAPPEGLYHEVPVDFDERRVACDLYQLGSMICFVFAGISFNALMWNQLHPSHNWNNWRGSFNAVLPYWRDAHGRALQELSSCVPSALRDDILRLVASLCDPETGRRATDGSRPRDYRSGLERVVSRLDLMARRAEYAAEVSP